MNIRWFLRKQFHIRRDIEVVITRRSWKFASTSVAKRSKSLVNTGFSGTPKAIKNRISKNISKKFNKPMISAKAVSYTEGYRSGHNEAVLKTVCPLDTWVRISHPPPPKSLENTTFLRLFSFLSFSDLTVFLSISRIFLAIFQQIKSPKNLYSIRLFGTLSLDRFLGIVFVFVVRLLKTTYWFAQISANQCVLRIFA